LSSDKSVEELIALATQNIKDLKLEESKEKYSDAHRFILANNIKAGTKKIAASLIYKKYVDWMGKQKKLSRYNFFKQFKLYFQRKNTMDETCYLLDPEAFDLSDSAYWEARNLLREEREKAQKEASKEKADQKK
jgi:hypothetical protein